MSVCCECCVLSGRCLCDGLVPRPESYRIGVSKSVWSWSLEKWGSLGPQGAVEPLEKKKKKTSTLLHVFVAWAATTSLLRNLSCRHTSKPTITLALTIIRERQPPWSLTTSFVARHMLCRQQMRMVRKLSLTFWFVTIKQNKLHSIQYESSSMDQPCQSSSKWVNWLCKQNMTGRRPNACSTSVTLLLHQYERHANARSGYYSLFQQLFLLPFTYTYLVLTTEWWSFQNYR
jgi:hypothetical protein